MRKVNVQPALKNIKTLTKKISSFFKKINWKKVVLTVFKKIKSSWKLIAIILPLFVVLYYPLGGYLMQNIDTDTKKDIKVVSPEQSNLVNSMAYLVDKEVNQNVWMPNLPFFFPCWFLDNMPSFQEGEIDAVAKTAKDFSVLTASYSTQENSPLSKAAQYLLYPPKVWMFAPDSDAIFAPSSATQYRKGKHELMLFNQQITDGKIIFSRSSTDLEKLLAGIEKNILISVEQLQNHIRENQELWFDFQADNLFYYTKGKLYAYYIILKAIGDDYKSIIVETQMYAKWSSLLRCLENASALSPLIVRNASLRSSFAPNHLAYMQMFALDAALLIKELNFSTGEL